MQREAGAVGRMLAHGVVDGLLPPVWERRAHEYPLTGEVLGLRDRGDRPLALRRAAGSRARLHRAGVADSASRLAGARPAAGRGLAERPVRRRLLRPSQPGQAAAAAARGVRAAAASACPEALLLLVGSLSPGLELESAGGRGPHRLRRRRTGSGRCSRPATSASASAIRRWARPRAIVVRALSLGRPLVVSDVGWFADLPDEVAVKVPVGDDEVEVARGRARASRPRDPSCGR